MSDSSKDCSLQTRLEFKERNAFFSWVAVAFIMFAFCVARIGVVLPVGMKTILPPGEYYAHKDMPVPLVIHVLSITLWSVLGVIQFVPRVRKVAIGYHRWAGRIYILSTALLTITGLVIMPTAFGGEPGAVSGTCVLAILFLVSVGMGFLRVRQRHIEEHRNWMIRNFAIGSSVIWIRLIVTAGMRFMRLFKVWVIMECEQVLFELGDDRDKMLEHFPLCEKEERVLVSPDGPLLVNVIAGLRLSYGSGIWFGLVLNMCCAELWIRRERSEKGQGQGPEVEEAPGVSNTAWGS